MPGLDEEYKKTIEGLVAAIQDDATAKIVSSLIDKADKVRFVQGSSVFRVQFGGKTFSLKELHEKVREDLDLVK